MLHYFPGEESNLVICITVYSTAYTEWNIGAVPEGQEYKGTNIWLACGHLFEVGNMSAGQLTWCLLSMILTIPLP